jgi:hypothetical protein
LRIGFDVDGVLARFETAYQRACVATTGRDLFPNELPPEGPPVWDWPQWYGYSEAEVKAVWTKIKASHTFWLNLSPMPGAATVKLLLPDMQRWHDIYFITNRVGVDAKWQTETWLQVHLGCEVPTVLITPYKGAASATLSLDIYIDDNLDNIRDVQEVSPTTRSYLLDRAYNRQGRVDRRVRTVGQMFDLEIDALTTV